ncbi:hypothetical protein [Spirillospora sp. CA-128828]|uniref:hypothetical protein n=1 Tax=Spirillospora sp. CA-128828 TaxID=3240033 RepID=UPI003D8CBB43
MSTNITPDDLRTTDNALREVWQVVTDPEAVDPEYSSETRDRMVEVLGQMAEPITEKLDLQRKVVDAVRSDDGTKLARLSDRDLALALAIFRDQWNSIGWGNGSPSPLGDPRWEQTLSELTNLVDQIS